LLKESIQKKHPKQSLPWLPILKAWNGDFGELKDDVSNLIVNKYPSIEVTLLGLLIHHQANMVNSLFSTGDNQRAIDGGAFAIIFRYSGFIGKGTPYVS